MGTDAVLTTKEIWVVAGKGYPWDLETWCATAFENPVNILAKIAHKILLP